MPKFFEYLSKEVEEELKRNAEYIVAPGRGILAADEAFDLTGQRFEAYGNIPNTSETRRFYRQLLFTAAPDDDSSISRHLGGVILHDETFNQRADDGSPFVELLKRRGIMPGVTVDRGLVPLGTHAETTTQGIDSLNERCANYKKAGAVFAKFRCSFVIDEAAPSYQAVVENAQVTARYASICQQNGLVPIVEPDISQDGEHDLAECQRVTEQVLGFFYKALQDSHVLLEGTLLKPNMCTPGNRCRSRTTTPDEIAEATLTALRRCVPVAVPGIGFLSGGQSEIEATRNLNAINTMKHHHQGGSNKMPWALTFIYGRALQQSVIRTWAGKVGNVCAAQAVFAKLVKNNGLASMGMFSIDNR